MRIDWYTKFVLTVIAACLVWLSLGGSALLPIAHAQNPPLRGTAGTGDGVLISGFIDATGRVHTLSPNVGDPSALPVSVLWAVK
jgi:hypothetical protein